MTVTTTVTLRCDGCTGGESVFTTSTVTDGPPLGPRSWRTGVTPSRRGWKQFRRSKNGLRRDFCPSCVAAGRAK